MSLSTHVALIEADALEGRQDRDDLTLIQVTSRETYLQAHIDGSILVQPQELVSGLPPAVGRLPDIAALNALFARIGYKPSQKFVIYDDEGGGWAGRFAWTLDVIGHDGWIYLNGGLHAWHGQGLPLSQGAPSEIEPTSVNLTINPAPIAEISDVLDAIDDPNQVIWDARSAEEYRGLKQASRHLGHIPGAVNLDWLDVQDPAQNFRIIDHLTELLTQKGISDKKGIITHCQTHHRSGLTYMLGRLLGLPIRAYHGSWSEWGNRDDVPIERES